MAAMIKEIDTKQIRAMHDSDNSNAKLKLSLDELNSIKARMTP